jgi:hypothetical protein
MKTPALNSLKSQGNGISGHPSDQWVKNTTVLARLLGLNRGAIQDARLKFPTEAPSRETDSRRENLTAWQAFCSEKMIGRDQATPNLSALKAKIMEKDLKLRDLKIAREKGAVIDRSSVHAMLAILGQKVDLLMRSKLEIGLGVRMAGKSVAEINDEGRVIMDEIREVVAKNIANFSGEVLQESRKKTNDVDEK